MNIEKVSEHNIIAAINYEALRYSTQKEQNSILSSLQLLSNRFSLSDPLIIHIDDYQEVFEIPSSKLIDSFLYIKREFLALKTNEYVLTPRDEYYPSSLLQSDFPPPFLYVKGDVSLLQEPMVYVTGTRNLSNQGKEVTKEVVKSLTSGGYAIVTGLDKGVEGIALLATLAQKGRAIAFLSTPLDSTRYEEHQSLQSYLGEHGVIVTPFSPIDGTKRWYISIQKEMLTSLSQAMVICEEKDGGSSIKNAMNMTRDKKDVYIFDHSLSDRSLLWPRNLSKDERVIVVKESSSIVTHIRKNCDNLENKKKILATEQLSLFD